MHQPKHSSLCSTASGTALACAVALSMQPSAAHATDSHQTAISIGQLQEVVVTARRRKENLQQVPIAVTVLSQQELTDNNIQTLSGLQFQVPSLTESAGLSRDALNVSIRGQGSNSNSSLPGVVAYLNEVPLPTNNEGSLAGGPGLLFDLSNVQVLRGPQGTLFGRNSVGGDVLLTTARPEDNHDGEVQLTYGNYDDREVNGFLNIPIVGDKLLARVALTGQLQNGFTELEGEPAHPNGYSADNRHSWATRGTLTYNAAPGVQNTTIVGYSFYTSTPSPAFLSAINVPALTAVAPTLVPVLQALLSEQNALGPRDHIPVDTNMESDEHDLAIQNLTDVSLGDQIKFRNILGYDQSVQTYQVDIDGTVLPIGDLPSTPRRQLIRQFTEEAQLQGKSLDDKLDWVAGLFYLKQFPMSDYVLQTGLVLGLPFDSIYKQGARSDAIYAQGTYDLSDILTGLKLTAGLRNTWDQESLVSGGGTIGSVCGSVSINCTPISVTSSSSAPTWTTGLTYQRTLDTMYYLTVSRGYRAGGANVTQLSQTFGPEYVTEYETGVKSDWSIGGVPLRTDADAYYQDYSSIQVQTFTIAGGELVQNAATAHQWGLELETLAQLTDGLRVGVDFDHLEFNYTHLNPSVDVAEVESTAKDNRPAYKYGVRALYRLPTPQRLGVFQMRADWAWQATSGEFLSGGTGLIPQFGVLNVSANWNAVMQSSFSLEFFMSNALNRTYQIGSASFYDTFGLNTVRYGDPRMFGVRLTYDFGR